MNVATMTARPRPIPAKRRTRERDFSGLGELSAARHSAATVGPDVGDGQTQEEAPHGGATLHPEGTPPTTLGPACRVGDSSR